ncbi:putative amidase [Paramyrothecium foliicola]|nr:putative amidase [Paramyrothecium foliicola]
MSLSPKPAAVDPAYEHLRWREIEAGVWTRDIDEIEEFYAAIAKLWEGSGHMYFAITGHISLSVSVSDSDATATGQKFDEALGKAWKALRNQHPAIASQTLLEPNNGKFKKIFKVNSPDWFEKTFVRVDSGQTGIDFANSDPPAPKLPTLFVLSPAVSSADGHIRRDLVLRSPHDIMDGVGTLMLLNTLVQLTAEALTHEDAFSVSTGDANIGERLSPPYRIAAAVPPSPTASMKEKLARMALEQERDAKIEQLPIAGLPFKQGETVPGVHKRVEITLAEDEANKLISAAKAVGATVTHVFHAAIALTLRDLQEKTTEARRVQYVSYILRNERAACKPPYNDHRHAAALYHSVSGGKLTVEMTVPSASSDPSTSVAEDREEFLRVLRLMTDFYQNVRNDPDHYAIAPNLWANGVPKLPVPLDPSKPLPVPAPELHPSASISSMGKLDSIIKAQQGPISVDNPWVTGEELRSGLGLFLGAFKGQLSLSAAYNDAWHDEKEIRGFLKHCLKLVNEGHGTAEPFPYESLRPLAGHRSSDILLYQYVEDTIILVISADVVLVKGQPFPSLIDVTIDDLNGGLESGLFTSVDLVKAYLGRIEEVNDELNVVTEINPDALRIAAELDELRKSGDVKGPLHGIPILIKNNIATDDKMNNTAGSWALIGAKVPHDSFMARKLREAGAVILGKANLSQWANYRSSNSTSGWSAHGGQVYGVYYPGMDPSGSSSGSGVASALGLALGALGTETSGSIVSPAQRSNLVGIKPTVGLTSRHLVIPISEHQDTIGPMTRTVKDAAIILQSIAGYDTNDNYTRAIPHCGKIPDYVAACKPGALKGARIGVPYNILPSSSSADIAGFWKAVELMRAEGAEIVSANFTIPSPSTSSVILEVDFLTNVAQYFAQLSYNPNNITTLEELREFTWSFPDEEYPERNTARWDAGLARGFDNTDKRFWDALQQNYYFGGEGGLLGAIERNNVDAIVTPTSYSAGRAAIVGAPIVTVPLGFMPNTTTVTRNSWGLVTGGPNFPFGVSFLGDLFSEEKLIGLAYAFEQKTLARNKIQPYIVPSFELGDVVGF